ncbi:MAG: serine/threonine protein kinase [Candidatus Riflebacteria bacterium]|nr:serine/threonine protein kinase [Candidatus Riflebacteria bacterium]
MEAPFPADCSRRFTPVRLLGSGGFGSVYVARQIGLERSVAVKILHGATLENSDLVRRFENEARVTASLSHPGIVKVVDFGCETGLPWIAYEYVAGDTLRQRLERGRLSGGDAVDAGAQVARALEAAHGIGVLHRDVKPENVLVTEGGSCKLLDFGVAKWMRHNAVKTQTGVILGTPSYLAPEYIRGGESTEAADIYALGATLFELLAGRCPFVSDSLYALLDCHVREQPPSLVSLCPGLDADLDRIVLRALAKDPRDRYASAGALAEELEGALARLGAGQRRPGFRDTGSVGPPAMSTTSTVDRRGRPTRTRGLATTRVAPNARPAGPSWRVPVATALIVVAGVLGVHLRRPAGLAPSVPAPLSGRPTVPIAPASTPVVPASPVERPDRPKTGIEAVRSPDPHLGQQELAAILRETGQRLISFDREFGSDPLGVGRRAAPDARTRMLQHLEVTVDQLRVLVGRMDTARVSGPLWFHAELLANGILDRLRLVRGNETELVEGSREDRLLTSVEAMQREDARHPSRRVFSRGIAARSMLFRDSGERAALARARFLLEAAEAGRLVEIDARQLQSVVGVQLRHVSDALDFFLDSPDPGVLLDVDGAKLLEWKRKGYRLLLDIARDVSRAASGSVWSIENSPDFVLQLLRNLVRLGRQADAPEASRSEALQYATQLSKSLAVSALREAHQKKEAAEVLAELAQWTNKAGRRKR